ncbi:MAG: hypothetical protein FJ386_05990 [Verrucomicrobia bacterium]|nr:hypothetical protein [Verrucomicrobiota bacterium]
MNDWNLQARAHACQACELPFADAQPYHTLLYDAQSEYRRQDICEPCWTRQFSQGAADRKGFISHWQGIYEAPPAAAPDPIRRETAETLLRKLTTQNDPQHRAVCYILAVMLERKRLLKVTAQSHENGQRVFHYEHPKSGDLFTIPDPNLHLDQLQDVQRQVASLMAQRDEPAAPVPAEVTAAVPESPEATPAAAVSPA